MIDEDKLDPLALWLIALGALAMIIGMVLLLYGTHQSSSITHKYYQRHGYDVTLEEIEAGIRPCTCQQQGKAESK